MLLTVRNDQRWNGLINLYWYKVLRNFAFRRRPGRRRSIRIFTAACNTFAVGPLIARLTCFRLPVVTIHRTLNAQWLITRRTWFWSIEARFN